MEQRTRELIQKTNEGNTNLMIFPENRDAFIWIAYQDIAFTIFKEVAKEHLIKDGDHVDVLSDREIIKILTNNASFGILLSQNKLNQMNGEVN